MPWQTVPHLSVPSSTHLSRSEFSKSHLLCSKVSVASSPLVCLCCLFDTVITYTKDDLTHD